MPKNADMTSPTTPSAYTSPTASSAQCLNKTPLSIHRTDLKSDVCLITVHPGIYACELLPPSARACPTECVPLFT